MPTPVKITLDSETFLWALGKIPTEVAAKLINEARVEASEPLIKPEGSSEDQIRARLALVFEARTQVSRARPAELGRESRREAQPRELDKGFRRFEAYYKATSDSLAHAAELVEKLTRNHIGISELAEEICSSVNRDQVLSMVLARIPEECRRDLAGIARELWELGTK